MRRFVPLVFIYYRQIIMSEAFFFFVGELVSANHVAVI